MGELLYKCADDVLDGSNPTSIYAPIGKYKDLLPYLVRRLLENGANSSFINRLLDPETDSSWLASGPHLKIENEKKDIPLPENIFINRNNSKGIDISEMENLELINNRIKEHKNKDKAMDVLRSRLYEQELAKKQAADSEKRKSMVSSGDRSAKIRTYNYSQGRVTEHRIGLTLYDLSNIINGDIQKIISELMLAENTEKLKADNGAI